MEKFVIGILTLTMLPVAADPSPSQSPAQLEASASPSTDAQMPSQADKADIRQAGKAQVAANQATPNKDQAAKQSGTINDQQIEDKAAIDTGANDGGSAAHTVTP
jgi:hypothetical protein